MIGWVEKIAAQFGEKPAPRVVAASLFAGNESMGLPDESLPFDLLVDESHALEFDVTDHRVEDGSTIADMIRQRDRRVTVTGMFTDHPVGGRMFVDSEGNVRDKDDLVIKVDGTEAVIPSSLERWKRLEGLAKERRTVRLVTALETYDEMAIERVSARRSGRDGESVTFSMTLREIRTAKTKALRVSGSWDPPQPTSMDTPEKRAMTKKSSNGKVSAKATDATDEAKRVVGGINGEFIDPTAGG